MKPTQFAVVLAAATLMAPNNDTLNVIRVHPADEAEPRTEITVTFDRPVSGGLDATVDPRTVFRIDPATSGKLDWRDPVTLRFVPSTLLTPGATYRVVVNDNFQAMDGAKLNEPYLFNVRVRPARVVAGTPIGPHGEARFIPQNPTLSVLIDAPADVRLVTTQTSITLAQQCGGLRIPM